MLDLSILCSTCIEILSAGPQDGDWRPHHPTLKSFREAVSQNCFICSIILKGIPKETLDKWENDDMEYRESTYCKLIRSSCIYTKELIDLKFPMLGTSSFETGPSFVLSPYKCQTVAADQC
jgi:hypothetical protein